MKYKSKPVEIEALRFMGGFSRDEMLVEWGNEFSDRSSYRETTNTLIIKTLEGDHTASLGDWIIKGLIGEFYPCKDEVFQRKYEPV